MSRTVLVWVDLETTGLDKENGRILEYAVVLTDLELNELASLSSIIPQHVGFARIMMDDYVTDMHKENGLLAELEDVEGERDCIQYSDSIELHAEKILALTALVATDNTIFVIAGSTIGFDKGWIEEDMPKLFKALHYRQLDVSGYKVGFPELFGTATSSAHRAMGDIQASIDVHRRMRMIVNAGVKALANKGVILGV